MRATLCSSPREKPELEVERRSLPADVLLYIFDLAVENFDPRKDPKPSIDPEMTAHGQKSFARRKHSFASAKAGGSSLYLTYTIASTCIASASFAPW